MPTLRPALLALAALPALAAPAPAGAATLVVPECSAALPGQRTVALRGTGFRPGSLVQLAADGQAVGTVQADAAGGIADTLLAPALSSLRRTIQTFQLTGTDDAGTTATVPLQVVRVTATLPERARPASRVRFRVSGFQPGRRVYLHVRRNGRTRGTFRIGTATAPCGVVSRRMRYMPLRRFTTGVYDYVFQLSPRFRPADPAVRLRVSIVRRRG